jgi:hypothetical protein
MADRRVLWDHQEIREWAAARMGSPAVVDVSPETGVQPQLRIVFDQAPYQDQDRPERPPNAGGYDLVEWDEWFTLFDASDLALVVLPDQPGVRDNTHEFRKRDR